MSTMVTRVFKVLGVLTLSLIVCGVVFSGVLREQVWQALKVAMVQEWYTITYDEGREMTAYRTEVYEGAEVYQGR